MKVVWTRLAEKRAEEVFASIARERPSGAVKWLERVLKRVDHLRTHPDLGPPVPELARPDYRQFLVKPYRVVYRRDPALVAVLTIRHVRQDWEPREISEV